MLYGITILYMIGAFSFEEFHPFSNFPMYSQLPNWSYVFFFVDENNKLIPCSKLNFTGGRLGHLFYKIAESEQIKVGYGVESKAELTLIGSKMVNEVLKHNNHGIAFKHLKLVRKHFFYEANDNKINAVEKLMYEKSLE